MRGSSEDWNKDPLYSVLFYRIIYKMHGILQKITSSRNVPILRVKVVFALFVFVISAGRIFHAFTMHHYSFLTTILFDH